MNFLLVALQEAHIGEPYVFPLGMAYISSSLKEAGVNVYCINTNHIDGELTDILSDAIFKYKADVVMTGGMSVQFAQINDIVSCAKAIKPTIVTVVGGPIATCDPELALRNMNINYCVLEEGEITAVELAISLRDGKDMSEIQGIGFLDSSGNFVKTTMRGAIEPLDKLPFPDYEGFEFSKYLKTIDSSSNSILKAIDGLVPASIITSRSCPFSCTFCYHPLGKKYRQRTLDNVFKEIEFLITKYGITYLDVMDELFSINKDRMHEFAERIKQYNIKWSCQLRVNDVTDELLITLKESGLVSIVFGVESIDNDVLKSMKKKIVKERIENALDATRKAKIMIVGNLLFGDVADSEDTLASYVEWKQKNRRYSLNLVPIKVIPDAPLYRLAVERGKIADKFDFMKKKFPYINLTKMDDDTYYKWLSYSQNINQYDERMFLVGKVDSSAECGKDAFGKILYNVGAECPDCGNHNMYSNLKQTDCEKYNEFICRSCFQRYRLLTADVFSGNFSTIDRLKFGIVHYVLMKYNANYAIKKELKKRRLLFSIFNIFINNFKYSSQKKVYR